jgi:enamine deaminase RidA (YjgF/YER057c/UK114 family)
MVQKVTWKEVNQPSNSLLSPSMKSNGHVFTSGCLGIDDNGNMPESVAEQTELAIKNLEKVLIASGSSLDKVLKVLLFVADGSYAAEVNKVYAKYFTTKPGRSCVVVGFPNPNIKVELECVAEYLELKPKL